VPNLVQMNNYQKASSILLIIALLFSSCGTVRTFSVEDCMKACPSPSKYDEFITRYMKANLYYNKDSAEVYEIFLPGNYDKEELFRYTDGQFDYGLQGGELYYSYGCSCIYFFSSSKVTTNYPDTTYVSICDMYNGRKTHPFPLMLEGVDSIGLYWKNINYECESYGYRNVLKEDKAIFDSILNSVKRIK
jgi:hypothetical protein